MSARCQRRKAWETTRGRYACARGGFQTAAVAGTIFQDTKADLRLWFRAMGYVTNQKSGVSALGLQWALGGAPEPPGPGWLHQRRAAMVRPGRDRRAGTVEVDEVDWGGPRPGKRGRGAAGKTLIVIAAQVGGRRIGRSRLQRVPDASAPSLERAVPAAVEPGRGVRTDGLSSYSGWPARGYVHELVRKEALLSENLLPRVNRVVVLFKRELVGTDQGRVDPTHLDAALAECTFRFHRRTARWRGKLFDRLAQQAVAMDARPAKRARRPLVAV